jgi:hypothetical protein
MKRGITVFPVKQIYVECGIGGKSFEMIQNTQEWIIFGIKGIPTHQHPRGLIMNNPVIAAI